MIKRNNILPALLYCLFYFFVLSACNQPKHKKLTLKSVKTTMLELDYLIKSFDLDFEKKKYEHGNFELLIYQDSLKFVLGKDTIQFQHKKHLHQELLNDEISIRYPSDYILTCADTDEGCGIGTTLYKMLETKTSTSDITYRFGVEYNSGGKKRYILFNLKNEQYALLVGSDFMLLLLDSL